jgi:hypothetical protein
VGGSAVCDTGLVRCTIYCQDCASAFARCSLEARHGSASRCTPELNMCRPENTLATGNPKALITFKGGNGGSAEGAVVIMGARNTREGLQAQSLWVGKTYWGWRRNDRTEVAKHHSRVYDQVAYLTPQGDRKTVYFDITDFYGKF